MAYISFNELNKYINDNNKIGEGKEASVYCFNDKVIKIFHIDRIK